MPKTVLSGMQPSGILHIGNYIGGIVTWKNMIAKNPNYEYYFMIADLHSLTSLKNGDLLRKNIIDCAICYYACGIDFMAENITLFQQSKNPNHSELAWILQTIIPMGWMERMTQFKDKKLTLAEQLTLSSKTNINDPIAIDNKIKNTKDGLFKKIKEIVPKVDIDIFNQEFIVHPKLKPIRLDMIQMTTRITNQKSGEIFEKTMKYISDAILSLTSVCQNGDFKGDDFKSELDNKINTALLTYPALMAADILLYNADFVPVGDDQKQHIELTRDVAMRFNREYKCDILKQPQPIITADTRIMSLTDGTKKMSKSDPSEASRILLTDSNDEIIKKISRAKTDSIMGIYYDKKNRPDISNLIQIFACLSNKSNEYISNECKNLSTKQFKDLLASKIIETISPIREKIKILKTDSNIEKILQNGIEKSKLKSESCMNKVRSIIGI